MNVTDAIPASFADRALFEPIAAWLGRFTAPGVPVHTELDAVLADAAPAAPAKPAVGAACNGCWLGCCCCWYCCWNRSRWRCHCRSG